MSLETRHAILDALLTVLDEEHARAIIEHRRVTIKKPLTAYGASRLAKKLAAWGNANEAADIMIDKVWQGFEVEWVKGWPKQIPPFGNRKPNAVDALQQIFEERGWHEPEFVHGDNRNGQCVSPERGERQGVVVDLRAGAYRRG